MTEPITLRGMTWNHPRGYSPMEATARRFTALNPHLAITWDRQSLKAFEDFPVEQLARDYDLIVLDHPCIPSVSAQGVLLPLDLHLPADFLADLAANSVGASHRTYSYRGHQWALAIDAATPVAFWREDLLSQHRVEPPEDWEALLTLADRGLVEIPAAPINCLMNFYALCLAEGGVPFAGPEELAPAEAARAAFLRLRELLSRGEVGGWERNPIASHDKVTADTNHSLVYCPLAYGYSNYARAGFAPHRLSFGEPPRVNGRPLQTTLGGAGLAVSARSRHLDAALAYAWFVASAEIQRTLYAQSGGQPGHRLAWLDAENNRSTGDYFSRTLPTLDRAFVRPQFPGYIPFQEEASEILHTALRSEASPRDTIARLDACYRAAVADAPLPQ